MTSEIFIALGGVGIFLLGMVVLTDGLKQLSGNALRQLLARHTSTPLRGAVAGALTTAVVQSSSATTIAAVSFVGAGLLTFGQGLGIVFGANVGTTATAWLVAVLGFKVKIGTLAMPLVFVGVLAHMFMRGKLRAAGWAIAGFGLLFVGIDIMQSGMASLEGQITPSVFPDNSFTGRLRLVLIGMLVTAVTQSSSAGVAAALVALSAGAISFHQAAAMVIGMNVGTTVTAVLATIGGTTDMRRTACAHVLFNVATGCAALLIIDPYVRILDAWLPDGIGRDSQMALAGFHTFFNLVGASVFIPAATSFAGLVVRLVPERGPRLLEHLNDSLLEHPAAAVDAAVATLRGILNLQLLSLEQMLPPESGRLDSATAETIGRALDTTREYVSRIRTGPDDPAVNIRHESVMHVLDHVQRLHHRCTQEARIHAASEDHRLSRLAGLVRTGARRLRENENTGGSETWLDRARSLIRRQRRTIRAKTVDAAAEQKLDAGQTLRRLDAVRWLHRVAYHLWRLQHHLERAELLNPSPTTVAEAAIEAEDD